MTSSNRRLDRGELVVKFGPVPHDVGTGSVFDEDVDHAQGVVLPEDSIFEQDDGLAAGPVPVRRPPSAIRTISAHVRPLVAQIALHIC
jgi:hypothetical protein